jgi:hypothetical protein
MSVKKKRKLPGFFKFALLHYQAYTQLPSLLSRKQMQCLFIVFNTCQTDCIFYLLSSQILVSLNVPDTCVLPPLWSSGQSSWLQIRRPRFDSRHYKKKVVGLKRGPLSLVSTTEELLDRKPRIRP